MIYDDRPRFGPPSPAMRRLLRPSSRPDPAPRATAAADIKGAGRWGTGESPEAYNARWNDYAPLPLTDPVGEEWLASLERHRLFRRNRPAHDAHLARYLANHALDLDDVADDLEFEATHGASARDEQQADNVYAMAGRYRADAERKVALVADLRASLPTARREELDRSVASDAETRRKVRQAVLDALPDVEDEEDDEQRQPTDRERAESYRLSQGCGLTPDQALAVIMQEGLDVHPRRAERAWAEIERRRHAS